MTKVKPLNTKTQKQVGAELEASGGRIEALQVELAEEAEKRDALILKGSRAGMSLRQLADRARVSRPRVQQILNGGRSAGQ